MPDGRIRDPKWVAAFINRENSIADLAHAADVTPATARTWVKRHGLAFQRTRPGTTELGRRYTKLGSIAALAAELDVAPETARRWLIDAGIELLPRGRQRGARVVEVDVKELRRRRDAGESLRALAASTGRDWRTVKRLLGETE